MLDMIIRNIWQRKTRSLLTVIGVAAAVMLFLYMYSIMNYYDRDMKKRIAGFAGKVVVTGKSGTNQGFTTEGSMVPMAEAQAVLTEAGIDRERSSAILFQELVANPAPNMPPTVMAVGLEPGREGAFLANGTVRGSAVLQTQDQVILGAKAAKHYGRDLGDTLILQERPFVVAGLIDPSNELVDSAVLMPLATAQDLFYRTGVVSAVYLTVDDPEGTVSLARALQAKHEELQVSAPEDMARSAREMLAAQRIFFNGIEGTALIVSLIVITIVMVMAVAERKKEIGTLKAIGTGGRTILGLIIGEAVLLSFIGGLLAVPLTMSRFTNYREYLDPAAAVTALGLTLVIGAAAALWPALRALRVDPLESLRYE